MIYKTYEKLKNNDLKLNDKIIFKHKNIEYIYQVCQSYLQCLKVTSLQGTEFKNYRNDIIFSDLNLDPYSFCKLHYISCPEHFENGVFPYYYNNDFKSAKNVALALFLHCNDPKLTKNIWED